MARFHDAKWLAECRERAPSIVADFADRIGEGQERLVSPGCRRGCRECVRECAVRRIAAGWWEREHDKAERLAAAHEAMMVDVLATRAMTGRA